MWLLATIMSGGVQPFNNPCRSSCFSLNQIRLPWHQSGKVSLHTDLSSVDVSLYLYTGRSYGYSLQDQSRWCLFQVILRMIFNSALTITKMHPLIISIKVKTGIFLPVKHNRVPTTLLLVIVSPRIQNSLVRFQVQCGVIPLISQPFHLTILLFSKDRWY